MKAAIDRDCAEARRPASEQAFEELGAILHAQHDAIAALHAAADETPRQAGNAMREFAVAPGVKTIADRRRLGLPAGDIEQQRREIHSADAVVLEPTQHPRPRVFGIISVIARAIIGIETVLGVRIDLELATLACRFA